MAVKREVDFEPVGKAHKLKKEKAKPKAEKRPRVASKAAKPKPKGGDEPYPAHRAPSMAQCERAVSLLTKQHGEFMARQACPALPHALLAMSNV